MVQSRPIRINDSLNCNMSETSWGMKLTIETTGIVGHFK